MRMHMLDILVGPVRSQMIDDAGVTHVRAAFQLRLGWANYPTCLTTLYSEIVAHQTCFDAMTSRIFLVRLAEF